MAEKKPPKQSPTRKAIDNAAAAPTTEQLVIEFMRLAGGPRKFAKMLYEVFVKAPEGGVVQQRILETIMRGMAKIDDGKKTIANLGHLTNEDLDRLIEEKMMVLYGEVREVPGG